MEFENGFLGVAYDWGCEEYRGDYECMRAYSMANFDADGPGRIFSP